MVEGQENPQPLADLALGQFRLKIPQLVEALRGRVRGVHRFRLKQHLERVDFIDAQIAQLEAEIEKQNAPFDEAVSLLAEIPGFDRTTAWSVIAEIGIDMNQFPSADHLASWAGVCPGNNESGGKAGRLAREAAGCARSSVRVLGAHPGAKTVTSLPSSSESPLTGGASERSWPSVIPCSSSAMTLKRRCYFEDLAVNYFDQLNQEKLTRYFVKRLTRLGHRVTLEPCSAAA